MLHFGDGMYRVLHKRSSITASFVEHLKFPEYMTFTKAIWLSSDIQIKNQDSGFFALKLLYAGCWTKGTILLFLLWSTYNFWNK